LKKADIGIAVEGATEAAKAASDIVLLTPGLSVIITGITRSRKIFQRMKNYCIYRITCTIQLLLFFTIAIIGLNFSIPTICLVALTLLNDGTVLSISYDKVIPAKKPEAWKLPIITGTPQILYYLIYFSCIWRCRIYRHCWSFWNLLVIYY
jgi:H+-transporting ATPase